MRDSQKITYLSWKILLLLPSVFIWINTVYAATFFKQFIDPIDGKFDTSHWLLNKKSFLPVPIIITEPSVGYGGGAALLFFHTGKSEQEISTRNLQISPKEQKASLPPSISGLVGLGTENGTWATGAFHFGSWKQDRIRYAGGVAYPSINQKYYSVSDNSIIKKGLDYNLEGWFVFQELIFRIKSSNFFLGPKLIYYNTDSTFDLGLPVEGIAPWQFTSS